MPRKFAIGRVKSTEGLHTTPRVNPRWQKARDLATVMRGVMPAGMPPEVPGLDYEEKPVYDETGYHRPKLTPPIRRNPLAVRMVRGK